LCYEVQFYVTFIALEGFAQYAGERRRLRLLMFAPLTVWSVGIQAGLLTCPPGFMVRFWYLFFLGALSWWALSGEIGVGHFFAYVLVLLALVGYRSSPHVAVGLLTGASIFAVGRLNRLETWLAHGVLQYLGRISYSLYLIHTVIGDPIVYYFRQQLVGPVPGPLAALGFFTAACTVSVVGAHLMYRFIEKPSVELAKRLKKKTPLQP